MLLSVNYHYVGVEKYPYPGIHSLDVATFMRHVRWLQHRFHLIGIPDLLEIVDRGFINRPSCLITFDDGLRCHLSVVQQLARKNGFPVAFYVSGGPLGEQRATLVHKLQYVRAHTHPESLRRQLLEFLSLREINLAEIDLNEARAHYRYDTSSSAMVKYLLNYIFTEPQRRRFIQERFSQLVPDEARFCREWYLTADEVRLMQRQSECIGCHAWTHAPLGMMSSYDCLSEMKRGKKLLEDVVGTSIETISYPLGNEKAVTRREGDLAQKAGFRAGWTMERECNLTPSDPMLLARIDCNDLPQVGKAPSFTTHPRWMHVVDGSPSYRKRYINERCSSTGGSSRWRGDC